MKTYKITLLSDSCISSGDISGTIVDKDACYDKYGLPYIPAKRIKGCLREIAEEIADWYLDSTQKDMVTKLFGIGDNGEYANVTTNNKNLQLIITDACLDKIEKTHKHILWARKNGYAKYVNTKNLMDNYTYIRYQTAMEGGVAKRNSLRSIKVVKCETEFFFQSNIDEFDNNLIEFFNQCCMALWHMGASRSRGLGHIKVEECKVKETSEEVFFNKRRKNYQLKKNLDKDRTYFFEFDIKLETPMIFPTHSIGCTASETYIPGSSIMGYFANQYRKKYATANEDKFEELFLSGNIIFQNAYITFGGESMMPVPLSLYKEKGRSISTEPCYDMMVSSLVEEADRGERPKLEWIGNDYCNLHFSENNKIKSIDVIRVAKTLNYHYKGNISKGNIKENEMFQMVGIEKNQTFRGRIVGKGVYIDEILPLIRDEKYITLGTSKTAQYGRGNIQILKDTPKEIGFNNQVEGCKKIVLILISPLILFNETKLSYSADINLLGKELEKTLGINSEDGSPSLICIDSRVQYKVVGGYNTKWRLAKEKVSAIDAGSVFVFQVASENIDMNIPNTKYKNMGEKTNEGYGEYIVFPYESLKERPTVHKVYQFEEDITEVTKLDQFVELRDILRRRFGKEVRDIARKNAEKVFGNELGKKLISSEYRMSKASVNKALLQMENEIVLEEFLERQNTIKDRKKLEQSMVCLWMLGRPISKGELDSIIQVDKIVKIKAIAENFLKEIKDNVLNGYEIDLCKMLKDENDINLDFIFKEYTKEFLLQAKLLLRNTGTITYEKEVTE